MKELKFINTEFFFIFFDSPVFPIVPLFLTVFNF